MKRNRRSESRSSVCCKLWRIRRQPGRLFFFPTKGGIAATSRTSAGVTPSTRRRLKRPVRGLAWRLDKSLNLLIVAEGRLRDGRSADRPGGSNVRRSGLGAQPEAGLGYHRHCFQPDLCLEGKQSGLAAAGRCSRPCCSRSGTTFRTNGWPRRRPSAPRFVRLRGELITRGLDCCLFDQVTEQLRHQNERHLGSFATKPLYQRLGSIPAVEEPRHTSTQLHGFGCYSTNSDFNVVTLCPNPERTTTSSQAVRELHEADSGQ